MLEGNTYLNIHTEENPAGEIRGQLHTETDFSFTSTLSGDAEVPPVTGNADGFANIVVSKTNKQVWVNAVFSGTTGEVTAAHLHNGMAGQNGDVLVNLTNLIDGNRIVGSVEIDASLDLLSKLENGEVYINLHTEANPSGELRGDLYGKGGITLRTIIDTEQEVPSPIISSEGQGNGYVHFNSGMDTISYMIYYEGLTGPAVAAHFHLGASGMTGPPIVDLSSDISGNWIIGTQTGATINSELVENFLKGQIYVNIHTTANAAGEIRGQLSPNTRVSLTTNLEGEQENPGIRTKAYGTGAISLSNNLDDVWYAILADNLTGEVQAAHFHNAEFGMNGDVVLALNEDIDQGNDNGVFIEGSNSVDITTEIGGLFANDQIYVNMHTEKFPAGELRGQVELYAKLYFDNGILPFDNKFSGRLSLHSELSSENEVHSVSADAKGTLGIVLSENLDTLYFNATVNNLTGPITGAHFHNGMPGEDGPVDVNLTTFVKGNVVTSKVTDFDLAALLSGQYYLNVHTEAHPAGEARGQVMLNSDWAFIAMVSPDNEVHNVTSDAMGMAVVRVYPDMEHIEIKVLFNNTTSAVTGAHLHNAPAGTDGGVVVNLSNDVHGNVIATTVMNSDIIEAMVNGDIYINIHTEDYPAGELRGQLELQNGVFFDTWLNGAQENPPTQTNAKGLAAVYLDVESGEMIYNVFTAGVEGLISGTHIHEGEIGVNGEVKINLTAGIIDNIITGAIDLEASLKTDLAFLLSGDAYVNVHNALFPAGAIRGQLRTYNREEFAFNLTGGQESPPVATTGIGTGVVSINTMWDMLTVDVTYANFDGKVTGAHIHQGAVGANGEVIINLSDIIDEENKTIKAHITAEGGLNSSVVEAIMSGNAYINIHSEENASGEMRGQVENNALRNPNTSVAFVELPQVNLYPNPVSNNLTINTAGYISSANVEVKLYDNTGRIVRNEFIANNGKVSIDASNIDSGVYFIEVYGDSNNVRAKFIKE